MIFVDRWTIVGVGVTLLNHCGVSIIYIASFNERRGGAAQEKKPPDAAGRKAGDDAFMFILLSLLT